MSVFFDMLAEESSRFGLEIDDNCLAGLERHWQLVKEANRRFNLTAITEDKTAAEKHYLDSLLGLKILDSLNVRLAADIGSGGGFPGLVLAIARPQISFTLIEASAKKVDFLNQAAAELNLANVRAVQLRAERAGRTENMRHGFDFVSARAVAHLAVLLEYGLPLLRQGGSLLVYKGPGLPEEIAAGGHALAELKGKIAGQEKFILPFSGESRFLCRIEALENCPEKYPRREGMPEKRML